MKFETIAIHAGERLDRTFDAVSVPIYQTSTFVFKDMGKTRGYDYSRIANLTRRFLGGTVVWPQGVAVLWTMCCPKGLNQ